MRRRRQELTEAEIARMAEELPRLGVPVVWVTGEKHAIDFHDHEAWADTFVADG